jgi:DeoR/GlpR family transcriptional regulator of sugar metabolism
MKRANSTEQLERGHYIKAKKEQRKGVKEKIAEYIAQKLVNDFDAVLLDSGSTAEAIAQELFTKRKFLSVMTNNIGAYVAYSQTVAPKGEKGMSQLNELILTGGRFDVTYEALFGDSTIKAIEGFSPNVTIIAVSGLMSRGGVFCHGSEEVRLKKMLWTIQTDMRVIAADWSKIGKRDAFAFGPQITDLKLNAETAVVVTCRPPRDSDKKVIERFEREIELLKSNKIKILFVEDENIDETTAHSAPL